MDGVGVEGVEWPGEVYDIKMRENTISLLSSY
jgi:hypothetical protein